MTTLRTRNLREAVALTRAIMARVATMARGKPNANAADLRRLCGKAVAEAPANIKTGDVGAGMWECYAQAILAGAGPDDFARLRMSTLAIETAGEVARSIVTAGVRFALIAECKALADTTFRSKAECDAYRIRLGEAFDAAIEAAADLGEYETQRALVALNAAATFDLIQRGRPLPRMVDYSFKRSVPSLVVAQRIYGDASREPELVAENGVAHPLFMPASGRALVG